VATPDNQVSLEAGLAAMEAIELHRAPAVDAATDSIYQQLGGSLERFGDRGRQCCREDLHRHVDYLGGSLVAGQTELFGRYIVWLGEVLSVRGVPLDSLSLSLELLQAYYQEQLTADSNEVIQLTLEAGLRTLQPEARSLEPLGSIVDPQSCHPAYEELVDALVGNNKPRALGLIRDVAQQEGHVEMLVDLVQPAMYCIGDRWKLLEISVAGEHSATAMAQRLVNFELRNATQQEPNGKKALFACVESNRHAFGLRMVADAFELDGWDVDYLGADVPTVDLLEHVRENRPDLVGLSVALVQQLPILKQVADRIRSECTDVAPKLIAGGAGLAAIPNLPERMNVDSWHAGALGTPASM